MGRIALTILATVAFVAFALSNTQHVEVSFVLGQPVETRLIFLMLISFGLGVFWTIVSRLVRDANRRALNQKMRLALKKATVKEPAP